MKLSKLILILAAALTAAGVATAIHRQGRPAVAALATVQHYNVRGEIRGIDGQQVRIKHEAIPGYMAAMTMPFDVKDTTVLRGLKAGDEIQFELLVTETDSWISRVERINSKGSAAESSASNEGPRIRSGDIVPDFQLLNQEGQSFRLNSFRGKAVLLTFIYTRCPLPNYCPLMSRNFASLQERLKAFPGKVELISISIDPQFDRPDILKEYGSRFTKSQAGWTFATGTPEETDAVGALFGLIQERAGGLINHDLRTALIDPEGKLVHVWKSNLWTPYEIQRRVAEVLGGPQP